MKKFLLCAAVSLTALSGFAQGVKIQAFTTNTGPVVTNIVVSLSSNLLPNRLSATNATISGLRVYSATNGGVSGFWLDPSTITPGAATNIVWPVQGSNTFLSTNGLAVTINALTDTNVVSILISNTASAAGNNRNVQFNNAGAFGGENEFSYNSISDTITASNAVLSGNLNVGDKLSLGFLPNYTTAQMYKARAPDDIVFDTRNGASWTNILASGIAAGGTLPPLNGGNLTNVTATIYVSTNGNNATGVRGTTNAFRDIYPASLVAKRGDTISVGPGIYGVTNNINIPDDGYLIGSSGFKSTYITNWNWNQSTFLGVTFHPGTNSTTRGFTFVDQQRGNSSNINYAATWGTYANVGQPGFQNARMVDCVILGSSDGVYIQHSNVCSFTLENVAIDSDWDCIMVKGEPSAQVFVPHQAILRDCKITGTHGGGWTNRSTFGVAMHSTGSRLYMSGGYVRITNTTFSGSATAVSTGTGASSTDVRSVVNGTDLYATTANQMIQSASIDDCYTELIGVAVPLALVAANDGINAGFFQTVAAGTLYGIPLPAVVTNWGGIPFLKWTAGSSNTWGLTRTNAGAGGILHRPSADASVNGNPTASSGDPYWGKVDLGTETSGSLQTASIFWSGQIITPNSIIGVNAGVTDIEESPLTFAGGVTSGNGNGITGDDEVYGVGWNGDTTLPTKNAVYDKIETLSGGGGGIITNGGTGIDNTFSNLTVTSSVGTRNALLITTSPAGNVIPIFVITNVGGGYYLTVNNNGQLLANGLFVTNLVGESIQNGTIPGARYGALASDAGGFVSTNGSGVSIFTHNAASLTNYGGIKVWRGLVSQAGTAAPTATVLENSLGGTITWARTSAGLYTATLASAFTANKTMAAFGNTFDYGDSGLTIPGAVVIRTEKTSTSVITIHTLLASPTDTATSVADAILDGTELEILVYP